MKHFLITYEPIPGGVILPPKGKKVEFTQQEDGTYKSGPVDQETALEAATLPQFSAHHEDDGEISPVMSTSTTVKAPVAGTGADGKPADVNLDGGDPNGVKELSVSQNAARDAALEKAEDEERAEDAGKKAEEHERTRLGLAAKPEAPTTVADGHGGTKTLNEAEKPEEDGTLKIEGVNTDFTENDNSADEERAEVENGEKTDAATAGVVTYADAGIPTDAERAKGETPLTPPSPTAASATPKNPMPGYTIDQVKSPDMNKQAPETETGKATGDQAKAANRPGGAARRGGGGINNG